jgi:hypothetical protein
MTDDGLRELFREMRDEAVPADSMARVRTRVASRIARRRWLWAGGLGLIPVCALLLLMMFRTPAPVRREVAKHSRPPVIETTTPVVAPAVIRHPPRHVRRRHVEQAAKTAPPTIRIETEDPNVVILLVGN